MRRYSAGTFFPPKNCGELDVVGDWREGYQFSSFLSRYLRTRADACSVSKDGRAASGNSFQSLLSEDRWSCYSPFRQPLIQPIDIHGYVKTYLYLPAFLRLRNAAYLTLLFSFLFPLSPFLSSSQRELRRHFLTPLWKLSFHFSLSFCLFTSL